MSSDTHHPKLEEIPKDCRCNEYTVQHRVGEEKQEKLVVGKTNTVVDPKKKRERENHSTVWFCTFTQTIPGVNHKSCKTNPKCHNHSKQTLN